MPPPDHADNADGRSPDPDAGLAPATYLEAIPDELARRFATLPLEQQKSLFRRSAPAARLVLLNNTRVPIRLVRSLPREDFYWTLKEFEPEDRQMLVAYASPVQLQFFVDLEIWNREEIDADRFSGVVSMLNEAGLPRLAGWLRRTEPVLLVAALKKVVRVHTHAEMFNPEDDLDRLPPFTLDGMHFLSFSKPEYRAPVEACLKAMMQEDSKLAHTVLDGLMWVATNETEVEAFEARQRRLTARGFPDPEDLMGIYTPMTEEQVLRLSKDDRPFGNESSPRHALARTTRSRLFLYDAVDRLRERFPHAADRLGAEMAFIGNKIVFARGAAPEAEDIVRAMTRTERYLSIGLEVLAAGDPERGAGALRTLWLEHVFRLGYGKALHVRGEALALVERGWCSRIAAWKQAAGARHAEMIEAVLQPHPQYSTCESGLERRDFETLLEVDQVRRELALTRLAGDLLLGPLGVSAHTAGEALRTGHPLLSAAGLILTVLADSALGGTGVLRPLSPGEIPRVIGRFLNGAGRPDPLTREHAAALSTRPPSGHAEADPRLLDDLLDRAFEVFAGETRDLDLTGPIDPRGLSCLWIVGETT